MHLTGTALQEWVQQIKRSKSQQQKVIGQIDKSRWRQTEHWGGSTDGQQWRVILPVLSLR